MEIPYVFDSNHFIASMETRQKERERETESKKIKTYATELITLITQRSGQRVSGLLICSIARCDDQHSFWIFLPFSSGDSMK